MGWYLSTLRKYAVFRGRACRREYWAFFLINNIVGIAAAVIDLRLKSGILLQISFIATFLPSLALAVRRLHDTGHSGRWLLIGLIPIIGSIPLLIMFATEGEFGDNMYGPDPLAKDADWPEQWR